VGTEFSVAAKAPPRRSLHLIVDCQRPRAALLDCIGLAVEAGVDWIHVRDHRASARDLFLLARVVKQASYPHGTGLAVHDRVDVALAVGADAVQLGERSLDPVSVRRIAPRLGIGISVHTLDAARAASAVDVDWLTFGHVFPTESHPGEPACGVDALAKVVQAVSRPVIAIGGITVENVSQVLAAGAAGIAVISAILGAADPGAATASLRRLLDQTSGR
jgi:thiamine-phosphate diphosphorylase